ncbi:MAG: helix-turn-helix domain-containing protein [Acidobacteriales bacterium]|nr:helix-turn-helix domain-containing protein [Terriglobales bacterium]
MTGKEFKLARKKRGWTQDEVAVRLGVSQTYVALLERGTRPFPPRLARKAATLLGMSPSTLPLSGNVSADAESLARQLSALGYPGFAYMRPARKRNPAEVLLAALGNDNLEARVAEALPWLLLRYGAMDGSSREWMLERARVRGLTNRLGFAVTLAKQVAERKGDTTSDSYHVLAQLEQELYRTRLAEQDTFCQAHLSQRERQWLQEARPDAAKQWNLLTNWRPEHLQYA